MADIFEDDGTLACLGITKNEKDKKFTCKEEQQRRKAERSAE